MSVIAVFIAGSLLFFFTTWATIAFALHRMHELQHSDLQESDRLVITDESGLTEIHVERPRPSARRGVAQTV